MLDTSFFSSFSDAVARMKAQLKELDDAILEQDQAIEILRNAPASKADVKGAIATVIEKRRATGLKLINDTMVSPLRSKPMRVSDPETVEKFGRILTASKPDMTPQPGTMEACILALLGNEIQDALFRIIDGQEWPESGPALDERKRLICAAEAKKNKLIAERETMRRNAADAGVLI